MNSLRALLALLLVTALAGCDATHERVYPTDDVSGRWLGTGAFTAGGTYDADLLFRQDDEDVTANGQVRFTDSTGAVTDVPYSVRATFAGRTLIFQTGFGAATLSEDGRHLSWRPGAGPETIELQRR